MSHKTTTHWKGGMQFESDNPSGKTVLMDAVTKGQSEQLGLSPKAMMLSALAGCSGIDIVDILEKMKVVEYELKMEVEGFLTEEHPKFYDKVHVDYHFYGTDLNPKKIDINTLAYNALQLMEQNNISQMIVVDNANYVGIVHIHEIIKEGVV